MVFGVGVRVRGGCWVGILESVGEIELKDLGREMSKADREMGRLIGDREGS